MATPPETPAPGAARGLRAGALALLCGAIGLSTLFRIEDTDVWWHVRTGRWIVEQRAIPTVDVFSHSHAGEPLGYTDWLAQVLFFAFDSVGGGAALVWGKAALVSLLAGCLVWLARQARDGLAADAAWRPALGALALGLALWSTSAYFRLNVRPELFSFGFFAVALGLVLRADRLARTRPLLWLVPLVALWGNFHRGATIVLALLAAAAALWTVAGGERRRMLRVLAPVAAGCVLALMANPGGAGTIVSAFRLASSETFATRISEWAPLTVESLLALHPWMLATTLLWLAGTLVRRRGLELQTLIVAGLLVLGWHRMRLLPFAAIAMVPGLVCDAHAALAWLQARLARAGSARGAALLDGLLATAALGLVAHHYVQTWTPAYRGAGVIDWIVPVHAAEWLAEHPPPGRMYNAFNLGGYLLYRLAPEQPVFIDGRTETLYPAAFLDEALRSQGDADVLRALIERHGLDYAVLDWSGTDDLRFGGIYGSPEWHLVYWDDRVVVAVRHSERTADYIARHGYRELRPGMTFERLVAWPQDPRREALANEVFRNLAQAPHSLRAHYFAAIVLHQQQRHAEYAREKRLVEALAASRDLELALP